RSTTGSERFVRRPPSGICQTFTVQSSEALAMTSSLCGHHWMSSTAALCPVTNGASCSTRPVYADNQLSLLSAKRYLISFTSNQNTGSHDMIPLLVGVE